MLAARLSSHRRTAAVVTGAVALATAAAVLPATAGDAATTPRVKPVVAGSRYLALGDSVAFGYRESTNLPAPDYSSARHFRGYPEELASMLGLRLTNAACPGETTASFLKTTAQSNGCENSWDTTTGATSPVGYRTAYPLHTAYTSSQRTFAVKFLEAHPGTRLVTLTIGANDGFLCQRQTTDGCLSEFPALLGTLKANLASIFTAIRSKAGYTGQLVVLDYYSTDYTDAMLTGEIKALNSAIAGAAAPYDVTIASGFNAFDHASAQAGGDVCAAQLVTTLSAGGCGVHPSVGGSDVLAAAVARRLVKRAPRG